VNEEAEVVVFGGCTGICAAVAAARQGISALLVMVNCMQLGQAAGVAAALAVKKGLNPKEVPAGEIQQRLRELGG